MKSPTLVGVPTKRKSRTDRWMHRILRDEGEAVFCGHLSVTKAQALDRLGPRNHNLELELKDLK